MSAISGQENGRRGAFGEDRASRHNRECPGACAVDFFGAGGRATVGGLKGKCQCELVDFSGLTAVLGCGALRSALRRITFAGLSGAVDSIGTAVIGSPSRLSRFVTEARKSRSGADRGVEMSVLNRHCLFGKSAVREPGFWTVYRDWPYPLKSES
jgi:hypothetical protein